MASDDTVFTPADFIDHLSRERGVDAKKLEVPERLMITYHRRVYEYAKELVGGETVDWWIYGQTRPLCVGEYDGKRIGVDNIWVGAPAAVMTLEELIVCGAGLVFEVGLCGGLQSFLSPGDIIVVTDAKRDEGTSNHYLPSDVKVESSQELRHGLVRRLSEKKIRHHIGSVWSTDGVYRETTEKFRRFRKEGALGVNMETSAIFALAKYRNVEAASAQVISDILSEDEWQQYFFSHKSVEKNLRLLVQSVLETLSQV